MSTIRTIELPCGLTVVAEPISTAASAALTWLLPAGSATDDPAGDGMAALLSELIFRGAGGLTSREHSDALDRLGVQRNSHVLRHHLSVSATMLGERLAESLPLLTAMVRAPALPPDALDPVRALCLQSLASLDDDPQHLVMLRLGERHHPPPFNRHGYGEKAVLERATIEDLKHAWTTRFRPARSIFAVAGAIDPDAVARQLETLLEGWEGSAPEPEEAAAPERGVLHLERPTAQVHIGVAWDAPREADPDSMLERVGISVLSGGTSGRLFTEVRQKRSLCYSVGASYRAGRDHGLVAMYAGTTPERAQETLDVALQEIHGLRAGAREDEFRRAVIGLKSHLIMQGESTAARAGALANDQFRIGRPRSLDDVAAQIDAVKLPTLNEYLARRSPGAMTVVSIGPAELHLPETAAAAASS